METNIDITASSRAQEAAIAGEGGPEGPVRVAHGSTIPDPAPSPSPGDATVRRLTTRAPS